MQTPRKGYLTADLASRENARRRVVLWSIAILILLSMSPVLGHHLARGGAWLLAGHDHLGQLCLIALHELLSPVHTGFHLLLLAGVLYAVFDRVRAWRLMRQTLSALLVEAPQAHDLFSRAAHSAGLDVRRLRVVTSIPNPAFTLGWLRPRVYVSRELAVILPFPELTAVLAHERAHLTRRDPLRLAVLRFVSRALFWIPALRRLADDLADEAEIAADDAAAGDKPLVLASAILHVAGWQEGRASAFGAAGFVCPDVLERRVRRLAGESAIGGSHVTKRSIVGASLALLLAWSSGAIMVHPLDAAVVAQRTAAVAPDPSGCDCSQHRMMAIRHLICTGRLPGPHAQIHCPHLMG